MNFLVRKAPFALLCAALCGCSAPSRPNLRPGLGAEAPPAAFPQVAVGLVFVDRINSATGTAGAGVHLGGRRILLTRHQVHRAPGTVVVNGIPCDYTLWAQSGDPNRTGDWAIIELVLGNAQLPEPPVSEGFPHPGDAVYAILPPAPTSPERPDVLSGRVVSPPNWVPVLDIGQAIVFESQSPIQPGMSGAPLVTLSPDGGVRLVGILTGPVERLDAQGRVTQWLNVAVPTASATQAVQRAKPSGVR